MQPHLTDAQKRALTALISMQSEEPGMSWFEHDHSNVVQLGSADNASARIDREDLRALNLNGLLEFDREQAPRWVFRVKEEVYAA